MRKNVDQIIQYCNRALERANTRLKKLPPIEKWTAEDKYDCERNEEIVEQFVELLDFIG